MSAATWEPGEPMHQRGTWTRPMFELIQQYESERVGPDAARWPVPMVYDDLDRKRPT